MHQDASTRGRTALLLIRTPLQAWLAEQVIAAEKISKYEILYFTHNDSPEDRHYFAKLASSACGARYFHAPPRRFDVLTHVDLHRQTRPWRRNYGYDLVLLASIDGHVINSISWLQSGSELVTFDDGVGNILPSDRYYVDNVARRVRLYRRCFGATDLKTIKRRIVRHYTLYPQFGNIVDAARVVPLQGWADSESIDAGTRNTRTYFLGQPFQEALSKAQIDCLARYVRGMQVDAYVRHPREQLPLELGVPFLDKQGQIAEEAVLLDARGHQAHVVGWFSTALLNLSAVVHRSTMLLVSSDPGSARMASIAKQVGCEVVFI